MISLVVMVMVKDGPHSETFGLELEDVDTRALAALEELMREIERVMEARTARARGAAEGC